MTKNCKYQPNLKKIEQYDEEKYYDQFMQLRGDNYRKIELNELVQIVNEKTTQSKKLTIDQVTGILKQLDNDFNNVITTNDFAKLNYVLDQSDYQDKIRFNFVVCIINNGGVLINCQQLMKLLNSSGIQRVFSEAETKQFFKQMSDCYQCNPVDGLAVTIDKIDYYTYIALVMELM